MGRLTFVTSTRLNRAWAQVQRELNQHRFWNDRMAEIDVELCLFSSCYGWQESDGSGRIGIPVVSLSRLRDLFGGSYISLADVLRHEYGHAIADTHRGLFRSRVFTNAFGATYQNDDEWEFDSECHVSTYAASKPCEDFAETFMLYVRHNGRLPSQFDTATIRAKWKFIRQLGRVLPSGKTRWPTPSLPF